MAERQEGRKQFSGPVYLRTDRGPVIMNIHSAEVTAGREALEQSRIKTYDEESLREAYSKLEDFLDTLPFSYGHYQKACQDWRSKCQEHIERYGASSILSILPADTDRNPQLLVMATNTLFRAGIYTKQHLAEIPIEKISEIRGMGERSLELAILLKDVAETEIIIGAI